MSSRSLAKMDSKKSVSSTGVTSGSLKTPQGLQRQPSKKLTEKVAVAGAEKKKVGTATTDVAGPEKKKVGTASGVRQGGIMKDIKESSNDSGSRARAGSSDVTLEVKVPPFAKTDGISPKVASKILSMATVLKSKETVKPKKVREFTLLAFENQKASIDTSESAFFDAKTLINQMTEKALLKAGINMRTLYPEVEGPAFSAHFLSPARCVMMNVF